MHIYVAIPHCKHVPYSISQGFVLMFTADGPTTNTHLQSSSITARAGAVVKEHNVSFDPHLRVFNVKGHSGTTRVVSFNPKATCSCPARFNCYHIIAVKHSIGLEGSKEQVERKSLSLLRKNARLHKDKKSGRKKPRPADLDSYYSQTTASHSICSEGKEAHCSHSVCTNYHVQYTSNRSIDTYTNNKQHSCVCMWWLQNTSRLWDLQILSW